MLASVQYQQELFVLEMTDERVQRFVGRLLRYAEQRAQEAGQQLGVAQGGQFGDAEPVGEVLLDGRCRAQGDPRLADAARPHERHQACVGQHGAHPREFFRTADEAGQLHRKAATTPAEPHCHVARPTRRLSGPTQDADRGGPHG